MRELMATPRRQAERLRALLDRPSRLSAHESGDCIRKSPKRWRACRTISAAMSLVSVTALVLGLAISLPLALASRAPAGAARGCCSASPASCRPSRASRCWRCSIRCCSALAALCERLLGAGFSALGFLPSVLALTLYSMLPVLRNTITGLHRRRSGDQRGRARRRHDAAAVAVHGRAAARAAGDHGRHPHRRGLGDRHRDAVDADRPDQPRQLHLHRPADAELGVRAVRLRRRRGVRARGRSVAGADRERRSTRRKPRADRRPARWDSLLVIAGALAPSLSQPRATYVDRRQAVRRAIRARRPDRAAAARRGPRPRPRATGSARA